jgi:CRP-like cAMP-binding protein
MERFTAFMTETAGLTRGQFDSLARKPRIKTFSKGETLLQPGGMGREILFVENGLLRQNAIDAHGKEQILHFAPENWLMSDRGSAHFGQPAEYSIIAIERTAVVCFDREYIEEAASISASFRVFNEKALHNHVRHLQRRIAMLLGASARERYLEFIRIYPGLAQRVPQWMIASYIGVSPEALSRVRKSLSRPGALRRSS